MTGHAASANWSLCRVQRKLRLSRRVVTGLIAEGFVAPSRGPRNAFQFSFQDLVLLRTAHGLRSARVPPRTILRALGELRKELPDTLPLSGLRVTADGQNVVVWDADGPRDAVSGPFMLDFQLVPDEQDEVKVVERTVPRPEQASQFGTSAAELAFQHAELLEGEDRAGAADGYRQTLALDPTHANAYINLGAMLCEDGECSEALDLFQAARLHGVRHSLLSFNRAVVLEDLGDAPAALRSYEEALALDPAFADAHFNAAQLSEKLGDAQGALRHWSAYRRLQHRDGPGPA
jgi:tetratricopeptide (TPR) repeat protein